MTAKVVPFRRRQDRSGQRLCEQGFHHWEVASSSPYDAVTRTPLLWRCARCAALCEGPTPGAWPGETPPPHSRGG